MFKLPVLFAVAGLLITSSAMANERTVAAVGIVAPKCVMQGQVAVNVQYNFKANSFAEAKKMFDDQNAKIAELAKQQKLTKFELQNQNYNISSQPMNYGPDGMPQSYNYQVNGNSSYVLDNAEAAFAFADYLSKQKIQVGLNSNSYKNGNCATQILSE